MESALQCSEVHAPRWPSRGAIRASRGHGDTRTRGRGEFAGTSPPLSASPSLPSSSQAQITVSDNGKGIPASFLPYVFEHFRQEDGATTRKFGGLGLGLAIVRQIVEIHGGTVQAESPGEGQGATFTVKLPLSLDSASSTQDSRPLEAVSDLTGIQVLVVDDDADTRDFVAFVLEQSGARVITSASADEALVILTRSQPDVLLSDIGMPETNGYMLLRQVRALPSQQGGQIPAIALTAYAREIDYQQAIAAGFQQHLMLLANVLQAI